VLAPSPPLLVRISLMLISKRPPNHGPSSAGSASCVPIHPCGLLPALRDRSKEPHGCTDLPWIVCPIIIPASLHIVRSCSTFTLFIKLRCLSRPFQCYGRLEAFVFRTRSTTRARWQANFLLLSGSIRQIKDCYHRPPRSAVQHPLKRCRVSHASFFVTPTIFPDRIRFVIVSIPSFFLQNSTTLLHLKLQVEASSV
jgi:hypothetical protein